MPAAKSIASLSASIPALSASLDLIDASITLDKTRAPYGEADVLVHLPAESVLELIDPRSALRVQMTAELEWAEPTKTNQLRTFDFLLHSREVDQEAGTLRLTLESDEAQLIDYMRLGSTADSSAEAVAGSLRAVINTVLDDFGAALEPGTADADFTITTNQTNLAINPRAGTTATGWTSSGAGVAARVATGGPTGIPTFVRQTVTNNSFGPVVQQSQSGNLLGDGVYHVSAWVRCSVATTANVDIVMTNSGGTGIVDSANLTAALAANTWTRVSGTITVTGSATGTTTLLRAANNGAAIGLTNTLDVTGLLVIKDATQLYDYFDGSGAVPADAHYTFAWTGTAHASTSTRTRLDSRSVDTLKWKPGVTAWDFVDPLVRASGFRLYCDEQRNWYLVDDAAFTVDGITTVSAGINATAGTDTISLQSTQPDGSPTWYSGVQVIYHWTDSLGVQQTAYDYAGTPQKCHVINIDRPYPGPGLAASRLALAAGRGRTQQVEALADLNTTPGQNLVSTLPGTPVQLGRVSAVTWAWAAEGDSHDLMTIRSEGLQDTPANAWFFAVGAWTAATGSWAAATGTN